MQNKNTKKGKKKLKLKVESLDQRANLSHQGGGANSMCHRTHGSKTHYPGPSVAWY